MLTHPFAGLEFAHTDGLKQGHFAMRMQENAVTLSPRLNSPGELTSRVLHSSGRTSLRVSVDHLEDNREPSAERERLP